MRFADVVSVLSGIVVVGFCVFLFGLAVMIAAKPALAERFLRSFASSARAHYIEQGLRLLVGAAIVNFARSMWYPEVFTVFGWLIVVTAIVLLLIPWRWAPQTRHEGDAARDPIHAVIRARGFRVGGIRPVRSVSSRRLIGHPRACESASPHERPPHRLSMGLDRHTAAHGSFPSSDDGRGREPWDEASRLTCCRAHSIC